MNLRAIADCWIDSSRFRPVPDGYDDVTRQAIATVRDAPAESRWLALGRVIGMDRLEHVARLVAAGPSWARHFSAQPEPRRHEPPPLEPESFLAWLWLAEGNRGQPMSVAEIGVAWGVVGLEARRVVVRMAAFRRKLFRLERLGYHVDLQGGARAARALAAEPEAP